MGNRAREEGNTQDHDSETGDDFNDAADDALVREGEAELESEEESDSEEEEQSDDEEADDELDESEDEDSEDEDQDEDSEDEEDEEADEENEQEQSLKEGNGKFNWKAINAKLGKVGTELERSFSEAQKTTNKALQAKSEIERSFGEYQAQVQEDAQRFSQMDHLYTTNQEVHHAINRALGIGSQGQNPNVPQGGQNLLQMPEGVDPMDPLAQHMLKSFAPVVQNLQNQVSQLLNHHQGQQTREQKAAQVERFRQGVISAGQMFRQVLNREPSDQELTQIAEKMRASGNFNGAELVPALFLEEIQKGARRSVQQIQKKKRDLPKSSKSGVRKSKTSKYVSKREVFDDEWDKHMK